MEFKSTKPQQTHAESQHRRQRMLQIWLPLSVSFIVVLALAVWAVVAATAPGASMTHWANVSAIVVILPICMGAVLLLAVVIALIFLTARIYQALPGLDRKVQTIFLIIEGGARRAADQSVRPIFAVNSWAARLKALFSSIFRF